MVGWQLLLVDVLLLTTTSPPTDAEYQAFVKSLTEPEEPKVEDPEPAAGSELLELAPTSFCFSVAKALALDSQRSKEDDAAFGRIASEEGRKRP